MGFGFYLLFAAPQKSCNHAFDELICFRGRVRTLFSAVRIWLNLTGPEKSGLIQKFLLATSPLPNSTEGMARYSGGKQWEDLIRKRQDAEDQEFEAQRAAASQELKTQCRGFESMNSIEPTLPVSRAQSLHDSGSMFHRHQELMPEFEAPRSPPPQYRKEVPFYPPAFDGEAPEVDSNEQLRYLQNEIIHKEHSIQSLEASIHAEKANGRRLQAARHEAVEAQRRADDDIRKYRDQVANLNQLLDESIKKEQKLENELDTSREEIRKLKNQLHEEQCSFENDIRVQERREWEVRDQLKDTKSTLESEVRRRGQSDRAAGWILESEQQRKSSVLRDAARHQRQSNAVSIGAPRPSPGQGHQSKVKGPYVSIPKGGNRRAMLVLS